MNVDNKTGVERMADLEKIAKYFETQAWDEVWPAPVICALARVKYPDRAPFKIKIKGTMIDNFSFDDSLVDEKEADETGDLYTMFDVRDKEGKSINPQDR